VDVLRVVNGPFQANCWIVGDGGDQGFVVDPGFELERVLEGVESLGLEAVRILGTHGHLDHAYGVEELSRRLGASYALHPADGFLLEALTDQAQWFGLETPRVPRVDADLVDGEVLEIGELAVEVVHTPGHTPGGCCLLVSGHAFVGDTLFAGAIGRTDLPGGDWEVYQRTLRERVLAWPDDLIIHSGHGEDTTIAAERRSNPFLLDLA
jgi:hydroxyacylglutathione hydrolase